MTLEQFCEEHDLAYPQDNREFVSHGVNVGVSYKF